MANIGAKFSLVKMRQDRKPLHLLISIATQILDEGNNQSLLALYLICVSILQTLIFHAHKYWIQALYLITISTSTLISPSHKYWISDLEKTRKINMPT